MENTQQEINFNRIARAIQFIQRHFQQQPSLEDIASHVHLSPFHFQRIFSQWAGISPKKFLQYTQLGYAKRLLKQEQKSLFDTHLLTGLSSTSRLHDMFIQLEGMTPAEYKNSAAGLFIKYSFQDTPFGKCIIASTSKGICYMAFSEDSLSSITELKANFPKADFVENQTEFHRQALALFDQNQTDLETIKIHLKGTPFQLKVWTALLQIPAGALTTYKTLACSIDQPNASRAVGTAIGKNPIAFLIPCHRVIQSSGHFGGYRWDPIRKTAMIGWELAKNDQTNDHARETDSDQVVIIKK